MKVHFSRIIDPGLLALCIVVIMTVYPVNITRAQDPTGWNSAAASTFDYWMNPLSIPAGQCQPIDIGETFFEDEQAFQLPRFDPIYGLNISGTIQLEDEISLVRVLLVDDNFKVLIRDYGKSPNLADIKSRDLHDVKPGGLGVHFMESVMDSITYDTSYNNGCTLIMSKCRRSGEEE